jgi:hypothetical protein
MLCKWYIFNSSSRHVLTSLFLALDHNSIPLAQPLRNFAPLHTPSKRIHSPYVTAFKLSPTIPFN